MKCEIVKDLLPLYDEKLCSAESAALVEEHLKDCAACRSLLEMFPKTEFPMVNTDDLKPFVKVKRKLRARIIAMIALGVTLLAILIPVGYLTVNQIFHINGGTDFEDLIYKHEMRQFAEMITEGRMEEYTQRYDNLHIGDAPDGSSITYRSFYLEKLKAAYEKVKKYNPRVGEIHSSYFNHHGDFVRYLYFYLEFTLSDGSVHQITILPGNYDGSGYGVPDWNDPRFMILLPELTSEKSDHEVYSAFDADDIPTDRREICAYLNLLYLADGGDNEIEFIGGLAQKTTTDTLPRKDVEDPEEAKRFFEYMGYLVALHFAPADYNKVYDGYMDFMGSRYTLETAVGKNGFDAEREMFYYPIVMIGSDGENSAGISVKLYYDEYGFHSPRAEDIKGIANGSDLEKKLAGIFG